jgi:hypothetical protein
LQVSLDTYSSITEIEEQSSIDKLSEKVFSIANRLAVVGNQVNDDSGPIYHAELIEESKQILGSKNSIVKVHEALRYLVTNGFLFEVENSARVCYVSRQPKRNSVYSTSEEEREMVRHAILLDNQEQKKGEKKKTRRRGRKGSSLLKTKSEEAQT